VNLVGRYQVTQAVRTQHQMVAVIELQMVNFAGNPASVGAQAVGQMC
jgi:hypothetical protein